MQADLQEVLRAAARVAYGGTSPVKNQLAQHLLRAMTDPHDPSTAGTISIDRAAVLCHVPASALLPMLKSDASFTVKQSGSGGYLIGLNTAGLLRTGRKSTKTGILVEELPTPVAYVDDLHPIRRGRPTCFHWDRYGRCAFNKQCVFDHSGPPGSDNNAPRSRQQSPSPQSFYQQDSHVQGSKGTGGFVEGGFASQFEEQPGWPADTEAHASMLAAPAGQPGSAAAGGGGGGQEGWASAGASGQQAAQVPAAVTAGVQQQQQRAAGPSRPGAAVCQMFMIRGFCPHGERCVYDHPTRSGPSSIGAGAAVTASVSASPQTQDVSAAPSPAASSRSQTPLPPYLHHSQQPRQQQQQHEEEETEVEQVQHEALQQPAAKQQKQHKREFPSLGLNEEGYPMFRGAPNCAYYMGTGRCDFNVRCKFHHPPYALHPECVAKGAMPAKFNVHWGASYGRLVSHLQRLWDYDSCDEARLKVWLAHHLLARENTGCSMFSATAAKAAVEMDSSEVPVSAEKPQGAYSCTLKEADQVLQLLWKAQPDEAARKPMPYIGQLRDLLGGDPYFELGGGKGAAGVKLNVENIKKLLNF